MQYSSPTTSSSSSSSSSQGQLSNNVLLLPSNTSKMSFIIPSNTTNVGQQQNVSSANILSSASNSGMTTPPITLNGTTSTANSGQISQQRLLLSQRSQSQPISQEEFQKILRALQDNNMNESAEIFKKEYQSLFNKTISSFSEPYFTALDGYISYVQEQPDTSRHEFSQLIYPLFVHMYLDLVEKDHLEDAQRFFMNYVKNTNLQATVFAAHKDDLFRIKSLVSKEQIAQSEYVKSFRHNGRYWIKLCNASLELLDQFLIKQQKYPLLTKIVQAYFQVNIFREKKE
jgi:transcription initiation factor TFIID subunit 5